VVTLAKRRAAAFEVQDDEDVEDLELDGGNHEHVDGDDVAGVVLEEGCPSLRPGLGRLRPDASQIAGHRELAYGVAQLQELPMNPGSAPSRVLLRLSAG
jgi:hypothetical protein